MKLIFVSDGSRAARYLDLASGAGMACGLATLAIAAGLGFGGMQMVSKSAAAADQLTELAALRSALAEQDQQLAALQTSADDHINALALRMGELNAHVIRLNALGTRLTEMADLEDGEFDFADAPALGGPVDADYDAVQNTAVAAGQLPDLLAEIGDMETALYAQRQQLAALEGLMLDRKLSDRAYPRGRPVKSGWMSSYFGKRADPVSGKAAWHRGVDFAGKYGDPVIAVSDGVVSYSGMRSGYGNLVEIRHGNGYVTRYAHNQENLVAVGDKITQGQTIALIGSTGRSTGPHVHFEVHRNGQAVDPAKYVRSR